MARPRIDSMYTPIPNNLREVRERRNFDQKKASERSDIPRGSYATLESGYNLPSLFTLEKIAKALRCKPEELYEPKYLQTILSHRVAVEQVIAKAEEEDSVD